MLRLGIPNPSNLFLGPELKITGFLGRFRLICIKRSAVAEGITMHLIRLKKSPNFFGNANGPLKMILVAGLTKSPCLEGNRMKVPQPIQLNPWP